MRGSLEEAGGLVAQPVGISQRSPGPPLSGGPRPPAVTASRCLASSGLSVCAAVAGLGRQMSRASIEQGSNKDGLRKGSLLHALESCLTGICPAACAPFHR